MTPMAKGEGSPSADVAAWAEGQRDAVHAWSTSTRLVLDGIQAVTAEALAFWQSRAKADLEVVQRLAECRTPEAFVDIQLDQARAALQAYADHVVRLGDLQARLVTECLAPWSVGATTAARRRIGEPASVGRVGRSTHARGLVPGGETAKSGVRR
jgi:hypothetical protein